MAGPYNLVNMQQFSTDIAADQNAQDARLTTLEANTDNNRVLWLNSSLTDGNYVHTVQGVHSGKTLYFTVYTSNPTATTALPNSFYISPLAAFPGSRILQCGLHRNLAYGPSNLNSGTPPTNFNLWRTADCGSNATSIQVYNLGGSNIPSNLSLVNIISWSMPATGYPSASGSQNWFQLTLV